MKIDVAISDDYVATVADAVFPNGVPCVSLSLQYIGGAAPEPRGRFLFDHNVVTPLLNSFEKVALSGEARRAGIGRTRDSGECAVRCGA